MGDKRVQVVSPDGKIGSVPESQLDQALGSGYRMPGAADVEEARKRQEYGQGLGTELRAGTEGAARALSFGTSDLALQALGADAEGLAERKARNPYAEGIGEGIGLIGGTLATGGLGALGAGVRGAEALGAGATRLAGGALAGLAEREGAGVASRALVAGASKAVGGAVEGGLFGLGQGISEASLGDPEDAANTLLAHATMGALFGGGLGAAVGTAGGLGKQLLKRGETAQQAARIAAAVDDTAGDALAQLPAGGAPAAPGSLRQRMAAKLDELAGEQALDAAGLFKKDYKKLDKQVASLAEQGSAEHAAELAEQAHTTTLREEAMRVMREHNIVRAGDSVADVGRKVTQVLDGASAAAKKAIAKVDAAADAPLFDVRKYADSLTQYAEKFADSPERMTEYKQLLERADAYRALADKRMGAEGVSAATARQRESLEAKLQKLQDAPGRNPAAAQEKMQQLRAQIDALPKGKAGEGSGRITLAEAEKMKRDFDSAFSGTSAAKQIARESRGMFNAQIESTVRDATDAATFNAWKQNKRVQQALIPVQEANIGKQAAMQANRKVSLTDYMAGLGLATGHPLAALGTSLAHKVIRERGNAVVSDLAARAAAKLEGREGQKLLGVTFQRGASEGANALTGAADAMAQGSPFGPATAADTNGLRTAQLQALSEARAGVVANVSKSVKSFVDTLQDIPKATTAAATKAGHEVAFGPVERDKRDVEQTAMKRQLDQLAQLTADPETFRLRLAESMGDVVHVAPRVAQEMHGQAWNAINFLYGKAPKNPYYAATQDLRDQWEPDPSETRKFERYARAVNDPLGTLHDMQNGHITAEAVEALKAVYPAIHQQMVSELVPHMATAKNVPLQRRLEVAEIIGTPLDSLTSPVLAATMQQAYAQQAKQPAAPARPAVSKNYRAQQATTPLQRALESV